MTDRCPACERGAVVEQRCQRCGVAIPKRYETWLQHARTYYGYGPEVEWVSPMWDYVITREERDDDGDLRRDRDARGQPR